MKSQFVALAIVLTALPALAWGQGSCGCTSRVSMRSTSASYGAWADYQPAGCGGCAPACCDPCCRPLLCIIPNTVKKIGCALDCLLPCGPRSCSVGCGSGVSCSSGCPSCSSPAGMGNPFQDDEVLPMPMPPKPKVQESRRQPASRVPRDYASTPSAGNRTAVSKPATKSVLTRTSFANDNGEASEPKLLPVAKKSAPTVRRTSATTPVRSEDNSIPHNPLR